MTQLDPSPVLAAIPGEGEPPSPLASIRKYLKIVRITMVERMTYRADFFLTTFFRFLPMLTTILLWSAVYKGSSQSTLGSERTGGIVFTFNEMIAYLLLVQISRMFSSMPGLAGGVAREIRDGSLKRYIVQPLDMIGYQLSFRIAHKITYIAMAALPYAILFYLCRGFFDHIPTSAATWAAFAASCAMAFLLGFFIELSVGMIGYWLLEVTSILYIMMTVSFFVSGHMFPLDLIPHPWVDILKAMPFQYLAYFPAVIFLEKVQGPELYWGLAVEAAWVVAFVFFARWLNQKGLRHYGAFGG